MNAIDDNNNSIDSDESIDSYVEPEAESDILVGTSDNETDNGANNDPNKPIGEVDLEIVGLYSAANGRSCTIHSQCGASVRVGDLLRLKRTMVTIGVNEEIQDAIKLVKITNDGVEGCTVAFLPRLVIETPTVIRNVGCFCVVKELYCDSSSLFKQQKSTRNMGMAGVVLLNDIPHAE
jgi:hypothetical protein